MDPAHPTILIIEDDERLGDRLAEGLAESGYTVRHARSVAEAVEALAGASPDLVLLDLGLPDGDGMGLLQQIRKTAPRVPVLITTARDGVSDRVDGLEGGADDYLVKPYAFEELLARIRVQLRQVDRQRIQRRIGDLVIDPASRRVLRGNRGVDLTPKEFDLLAFLASLDGQVASRETIQREVWQVTSRMTSMDNVLDVHLSRLRKKLAEAGGSPLLHTVRGVGIMLREEA